jgi:hypothetical protein
VAVVVAAAGMWVGNRRVGGYRGMRVVRSFWMWMWVRSGLEM